MVLGIVTVVMVVHPANADIPIVVTPLVILMEVSEVHDVNAPAPIVTTVLGIVTEVNGQPSKA